jgi:hypothetical protein
MATATLNQGEMSGKSTQSTTHIQTNTERFDIAYGFKTKTDKDGVTPLKDDKGNVVKEPTIILKVEDAELLSDKNLFEGTTTSVTCDYPATWDALLAFAEKEWSDTDENGKTVVRKNEDVKAEIVKLFNNGASSKVMNRLRAKLTELDKTGNFVFQGDLLDMTNEITSGSKRVFLTEEQKMYKSIAMLPAASKEAVWRAYLTSVNKEYYVPQE